MHGIVTSDNFSIGEHLMNLYVFYLGYRMGKLSQHQDMLGRWDLEAVVSTIQPLAAAGFFHMMWEHYEIYHSPQRPSQIEPSKNG